MLTANAKYRIGKKDMSYDFPDARIVIVVTILFFTQQNQSWHI